jgi:hypothetical protein
VFVRSDEQDIVRYRRRCGGPLTELRIRGHHLGLVGSGLEDSYGALIQWGDRSRSATDRNFPAESNLYPPPDALDFFHFCRKAITLAES